MAFGANTIGAVGGAITDLFSASAEKEKAAGSLLEGQAYSKAAELARQEEEFTKESTAVQSFMAQRQIEKTIGTQQSQISGGGFENSGTALDLLRESAEQGALTQQLLQRQGLINEASYEEQAQSYDLMSQAAQHAAAADQQAAKGLTIDSFIKMGTAAATLVL